MKRLTATFCFLAALFPAVLEAQPMSGAYPVGPGGPGVDSFPTVQAAAAALSSRGMAGNVEFPIRQFVYTGPVTVRSVAGSDSFQTRFYPTGVGAIIDAGGGRYGFLVESTDNVTVQGLRFRGCRDTGSAFLRFDRSHRGTVRSCRLEDSAQFGVQVTSSDEFRAESLRYEGDLLGDDSRGLDFRDCRFAFATRCTMLAAVGTGLWIEGGSDISTYRVTTMRPSVYGLRIANSPRVSIHNFVSRGSSQYAGYVTDAPNARFDSCVFAGAARTCAHFERCDSLYFNMGMGIGDGERAVAVVRSPCSRVMKLSVMGSPAQGLVFDRSPDCMAESTQYAGFFSDTAVAVLLDSSDRAVFRRTQMSGQCGRGISVNQSRDAKFFHTRMNMTVVEAGIYVEQSDGVLFQTCSLRLAGPLAAVLVADTSAADSFINMTIIGTPENGVLARGSRELVVGNSFIAGWTGSGVLVDQGRSPGLFFNTIVGPQAGAGAGVHLRDASGATSLDNIIWNRGGDSSACYRVDGAWPFAPGGSDHNDLYSPGGSTGRVNDTLYPALADWRSLSGAPDPASIARDPQLASDTGYHIMAGSPCRDSGAPVSGFEFDLDGDPRDPVAPDIGADEYTPPGVAEPPPVNASLRPVLGRNPTGDVTEFSYSLAEPAAVRVRLYDVAGRTALAFDAGRQPAGICRARLDLRGLATGVYLLELTAGACSGSAKLVRQ